MGAYDAEIDWLRARHAQGAILASSCSGAVLLARTGLLEGLDATSHWAYCDVLQRDYPGHALASGTRPARRRSAGSAS